ncbi:hypothetical protein BGW42_008542 [Actinomortierella wolfii]|nr:hypothetical protein BGW42_008542 [Actinomortierella wolfii]
MAFSDDITNGSESHAGPTSVDIMDINSNSECSTRKPITTITNNKNTKNNNDNNDNSSSSNSIDDNEGDNDNDMRPIRNKTIAATIDSSITGDKDLQSRALLIHLAVYDSNGTCLRFKYPITSFFTANNRKDDLPAGHAEQLAIVEQRNREIAAKYKKRRSGYRPRGITQVVTNVPDDEEVKDEEVETTAE